MITAAAAIVLPLMLATSPALTAAESAYQEGRFDLLVPTSEAAVQANLPVDERRRAHELLAIAYTAFNRDEEAVQTFRKLLGFAPDFQLPQDSSPRLRALFQKAQAAGAIAPPPV